MKNREAYAEEIVAIALAGESIAINRETLKPCACMAADCHKCLLNAGDYTCDGDALEAWAESEYTPAFKLDELVMVSDNGHTWYPRYYKGYDVTAVRAPFIVWSSGTNSITAADAMDTTHFRYCRVPTIEDIAKERAKNGIEEA